MRVGFVGCDDGNDNGFQDRKLLQVLTFLHQQAVYVLTYSSAVRWLLRNRRNCKALTTYVDYSLAAYIARSR